MPMPTAGYSMSQGMVQTQTQTLAPQMRESLKMLQMTSLALAPELRQQMLTNPVIEDVRNPTEPLISSITPDSRTGKSAADSDMELDFTPEGAAAENILGSEDGHLDYFLGNMESASGDEEAASRRQRLFDTQRSTETLQDHLIAQIPFADLDEEDRQLAEIIISNINDTGMFAGSYPDIEMATGADAKKIDAVRRCVLKFDPVGCGWKDPRECLLAQMDRLEDSPWEEEVRKIILNHLEDLYAHREALICEKLKLTPEELAQALAAFRTLDPFPGRDKRFVSASDRPEYVRPEVHAVKKNGRWIAQVDGRDLPEIRISPRFLSMLKDPNVDKESKAYVRERIRAAEALIEAVERRQDTIRAIAQEIVDAQQQFFEKGFSALRPLTMQAVADKVGVHGTTVSRTVRDKYMTTPFGTVELRRMFTSGLETEGGEQVSKTVVQERLKALVAAEDKAHPLSDDRLAELLKREGVEIARRTVAKYRDELDIPSTTKRKQRKNMV